MCPRGLLPEPPQSRLSNRRAARPSPRRQPVWGPVAPQQQGHLYEDSTALWRMTKAASRPVRNKQGSMHTRSCYAHTSLAGHVSLPGAAVLLSVLPSVSSAACVWLSACLPCSGAPRATCVAGAMACVSVSTFALVSGGGVAAASPAAGASKLESVL